MKPTEIVERLAATKNLPDQEAIIRAAWDAGCIEFFEGARLAFHPYVTFGTHRIPESTNDAGNAFGNLFASAGFEWNDFKTLAGSLAKGLSINDGKVALKNAVDRADTTEWNGWYRLILLKNLRCGVFAREINRVLTEIGGDATKYLIPVFGCQLGGLVGKLPSGERYLDAKLSPRIVAILNKTENKVTLHKSFGAETTEYPEIAKALHAMLPDLPGNIVLDGAMVDQSYTNYLKPTNDGKHYAVFDVIPLSDFIAGKCDIVQRDRNEVLKSLSGGFQHYTNGLVYVAPKVLVDLDTQAGQDEFVRFASQVLSVGLLIKDPNAPYVAGESPAWVTVDLSHITPAASAPTTGGVNSDTVYDMIEKIASDNSKNAKEAMVKQFAADDLFRRVLEYAYNPFKRYNLRPDQVATNGTGYFNDNTWKILDRLISRDLSGNDARTEVETEMMRLTQASADLLWRIIRKDLRANFSESTINKSCRGLIPEFPYMRCSLTSAVKLDTWDWVAGVISQEKADGMFSNCGNEPDDSVSFTSRQGSPFPMEHFKTLAAEINKRLVPHTQTHGELLVLRDGKVLPREIGNGVLNSVLKGGSFAQNEQPIYMIWDQIPLTSVQTKGSYKVGYRTRLLNLVAQLANTTLAVVEALSEDELEALMKSLNETGLVRLIPTRIVHSLDAAYAHYRTMLEHGKEGTVIKTPTAIWRDGTSKDCVKLKVEFECDLEIVAFIPGNGKNESLFGSILCRTSDHLLEVAVSGFSDAVRADYHTRRDELIGMIMTVKGNAIMVPQKSDGKYSIFLPRHVELRLDKTEADTLQRVKDQFEAAIR